MKKPRTQRKDMTRTSPAVNGRSTESGASESAELHIQSCCSLHSNFAFRERKWVCVWRWMTERERERKDRSNGIVRRIWKWDDEKGK